MNPKPTMEEILHRLLPLFEFTPEAKKKAREERCARKREKHDLWLERKWGARI